MDYRHELLLASAARLYSLGVDLAGARARLTQLVEEGVSFSSPEMEQAYRDFQQLNAQWKKLENDHLDLRSEIIRDSVQRLEEALLFDLPSEETAAALRESEQISKDPAVKGYKDMDKLFAALRSEPSDEDIQARIQAAESLFGCLPDDVTLDQAKKERRDRKIEKT